MNNTESEESDIQPTELTLVFSVLLRKEIKIANQQLNSGESFDNITINNEAEEWLKI